MADAAAEPAPPIDAVPTRWHYLVTLVVLVGLAAPVVEVARKGLEPSIGGWPAWVVGILAGTAVGLLGALAADRIFRHEKTATADSPAAMLYRPAALPVWVFVGALAKNFPEALTEIVAWAFAAWLAVFLAVAFFMQRRSGRAWSWKVALAAGAALALLSLGAAVATSRIISPASAAVP